MNQGLNIYRLSGVSQRCGAVTDIETSKYTYWTNGTLECDNTRAYNYLLGLVNAKLDELAILPDINVADTLNQIDLYIVCLEAIKSSETNQYDLMRSGAVINVMINSGFFASEITDDQQRAINLDGLVDTFTETYAKGYEYDFQGDFYEWWKTQIVDNAFNKLSTAEKENYANFFNNSKIGASADGINNLSEYIRNAGVYFLYLFIPETEIKKYKPIIQRRRAKEVELYEYLCLEAQGLYSPADIYNKIYNGVVIYYRMTPQAKIEQLKSLGDGGMGVIGVDDIIIIVSLAVSLIIALVQCLQKVLVAKYSVPDDIKLGIADTTDFGLRSESEKQSGNFNKLFLFGGVGLLGYFLLQDKKN